MIIYGDKQGYIFNIPKHTKVSEGYDIARLPRLYDIEQVERVCYELIRGSICQDNIESCGLSFDREGGRDALNFTALLGLTEPFKKNNKINYRLTKEGINVVGKDVGKFIEKEIFRFTPFLFIYDYIKSETADANRTRAKIIEYFNRNNPKFGQGDSGKKNIEVAISILITLGYLKSENNIINITDKEIECSVVNNSKNIIYMTIDDFLCFYKYLKNLNTNDEIEELTNDIDNFNNKLATILYNIKWRFIGNDCRDLNIEMEEEDSKLLNYFIDFLSSEVSEQYSKNIFIKKIDNNKYCIRTYFDISLKSEKIEIEDTISGNKTLFHVKKGDADKISYLNLSNVSFKRDTPFNIALICNNDIEGIEYTSKLNSFNLKEIGFNNELNVSYEIINKNIQDIFRVDKYQCIILIEPIAEDINLKDCFKEYPEYIEGYLEKGGNILFFAPIQDDFNDGKIENSKKGNDFFRDFIKNIYKLDSVPRIYHTGPQNNPHIIDKVNLTESGRRYLVPLGENLSLEKPIIREIKTLGVLTLPINIGLKNSLVSNFIPLMVPIDENGTIAESISALLANCINGNVIFSTFSKESFTIGEEFIEILIRLIWVLCIKSNKDYLKKFDLFI